MQSADGGGPAARAIQEWGRLNVLVCAQESSAYFAATAMINTLVPSIAHLMAQSAHIEGAMREVVATYWNNDRMTADEAMSRLVAASKTRPAKAVQP